jgi:alpha-tubulin suppressor-like RCC1 family protein
VTHPCSRAASLLSLLGGICGISSCDGSGPSDNQPALTEIVAGTNSTCALTEAGAAYCWGRLFDVNAQARTRPDTTASDLRFRHLSLSSNIFGSAICGVSTGSLGYCWGVLLIGYDGGLVIGSAPLPIGVNLPLASIRVASRHFCGLTPDGAAYCGGDYRAGVRGTGEPLANEFVAPDLTPNSVAGGLTFTQLALGLGDSCGLDPAGVAYCWGSEVALGNTDVALAPEEQCGYTVPPFYGRCSHVPVPVAGGHTFTSLTAGQSHVCGLTAEGQVYCWGTNESGQLGSGDTLYAATPVPAVLSEPARAVATGSGFTCAIGISGQAYCWGLSHVGQTGSGSTAVAVLVPAAVAGAAKYQTISAGESHACGLRFSGELDCWGSNYAGELGSGDLENSAVPLLVQF